MKQRKVYDRKFKENAVKLSYERDNMTQFARELGISEKQLYSWRIEMMCRVLKVSRSSYYYWLREPKSQRKEQVKVLKEKIQTVYFKAKGRYGSPRIKEELCRTGTEVSSPTVAKYMKQMGLKSKLARKFKVTTDSNHKEPVVTIF